MKNRYLTHSHISEKKFREILKYFAKDFTADQTADLTHISRVTINRLYAQFRLRIAELLGGRGKLGGEVEVDESYFGARRVRGKRGRGAKGKVPVVGLLKRHGKVYTQIISNCTKEELMPILRGKILSKSTVYTDGWTSYDGLITSVTNITGSIIVRMSLPEVRIMLMGLNPFGVIPKGDYLSLMVSTKPSFCYT